MPTGLVSIFEQNKLVFTVLLFFAFIVFVYMPLSYFYLFLKDKKSENWARKNKAVKFYVQGGRGFLAVFSVNGEKPVLHRTFSQYGFYLVPGNNVLHVAYQWQPFFANLLKKLFGLSYSFGIKTANIAAKKMRVTVKPGAEYLLFYDPFLQDYVFKELKGE